MSSAFATIAAKGSDKSHPKSTDQVYPFSFQKFPFL